MTTIHNPSIGEALDRWATNHPKADQPTLAIGTATYSPREFADAYCSDDQTIVAIVQSCATSGDAAEFIAMFSR